MVRVEKTTSNKGCHLRDSILFLPVAIVLSFLLVAACSPRESIFVDQSFIREPSNPLVASDPGRTPPELFESPMVIEENGTYYMYYHWETPPTSPFRIGLATADRPEGQWNKYADNPMLLPGPSGAWDDYAVGVGHVMKIDDLYYMWYMGAQALFRESHYPWRIGLATANNPRGPWTKYEGNPILDVGHVGDWDGIALYVSSVQVLEGKYYLWYVGFRTHTDGDGQMGLATASRPEGPWTKYPGNPVLKPGSAGSWDGGQINEAAIIYRNGLFHAWYAGYPEQNILRADIGYAYSADGMNWTKLQGNPVLTRGAPGQWDEHRISEPHALIEGKSLYLFFTGARYREGGLDEYLGMARSELE